MLILACCPATERRIPRDLNTMDPYILIAANAQVVTDGARTELPLEKTDTAQCLRDQETRICVASLGSSFRIDIVPIRKAVLVDWPRAKYVDERGASHRIYHRGGSTPDSEYPTAPTEVRLGTTFRETVAPRHKTYNVRENCFSEAEWSEPLVPGKLEYAAGMSAAEYFASIANSNRTVSIVVPVTIGAQTRDYQVSFALRRAF